MFKGLPDQYGGRAPVRPYSGTAWKVGNLDALAACDQRHVTCSREATAAGRESEARKRERETGSGRSGTE